MEEPPKKFFRLKPDGEVRLKGAYIIKCDEPSSRTKAAMWSSSKCSADLDPRVRLTSGAEQRKVKGTLHWVAACDCADRGGTHIHSDAESERGRSRSRRRER